jgi:hypothetical protein
MLGAVINKLPDDDAVQDIVSVAPARNVAARRKACRSKQ